MRRGAGKPPRRLNVGKGAGAEHPSPGFRVPGQGGINVIEQPLTDHKGLSGTASPGQP